MITKKIDQYLNEGRRSDEISNATDTYLNELYDFMTSMDPQHKLFKMVDDLYGKIKKDLTTFDKLIMKL